MGNAKTSWILELIDRVSGPLNKVQGAASTVNKRFKGVQRSLSAISAIDLQALDQSTQRVKEGFQRFNDVAIQHESAMAEVSAITGFVGDKLNALDKAASQNSILYGGAVTDNLAGFKVILSKLGPEIGNNSEALGKMGKLTQVLSKTMEGDVAGATDSLTNSMLQFRISLEDPTAAAEEMERMMNIMAAGAQEGSAEIVEVSQGLKQAGGTARLANVSFAETNSALQLLDKAGKKGAEGGVALRNVLLKMNAPSKITREASMLLRQYGVDMEVVSNKALPLADRLQELQKIGDNTNALTALFGSENVQGAEALINTAEAQALLTKKIEGTNVAYEQAATIMNTSAERAKRWRARLDLVKISLGQYTKFAQPFVNITADGISMMANMGNAMRGAKLMTDALRVSLGLQKATQVGGVAATAITTATTTTMAGAQATATATTWTLTGAFRALSVAMIANPIGLIIAAVVALIAVVVLAVKNYESWGAALLLFMGPLGMVINLFKSFQRHWESIVNAFKTEGIVAGLKRIGYAVFDAFMMPLEQLMEKIASVFGLDGEALGKVRGFFYGIWNVIKLYTSKFVSAIQPGLKLIWTNTVGVFTGILDTIKVVFSSIWSFLRKAFSFISNLFSVVFTGIKTFVENVFGGIYDTVVGIIDKIANAIGKAWNWLGKFFPEAKEAYNEGMAEGKEEYESGKQREKGKKKEEKSIISGNTKALFNPAGEASSEVNAPASTPLGGGASGGFGTGTGTGKSISMVLNITNHFKVMGDKLNNNIEEIADQFAGRLNDRLRDGVIALEAS